MSSSKTVAFDAATWPRDPANGRFLCAPGKPMPKGAPGQWAHTSIYDRGGNDPYYDHRGCRDCGEAWSEEVAE